MIRKKHIVLFLLVILLAGCAIVQPWEREYIADPIMSFDDDQADSFTTEVADIREASALGKGGDGGGCGCN